MIIYPTKSVKIISKTNPSVFIQAGICDTFFCSLKGFMFTKTIDRNFGLLFFNKHSSRLDAAIHMLFMNFDLTVLWLDDNKEVIDVVLAKKWHLAYIPSHPARYVLELHPSRLHDFKIGDVLDFIDENE